MIPYTCKCQDSNGVECGKEMTVLEFEQDGMCDACACNVWNELTSDCHRWVHETNRPIQDISNIP